MATTRKQVNSATLIMGPSGSGKSSLLATYAEWLWETYGKILRIYSCDGGGVPSVVERNVALGIVQLFRMRTRDSGDKGLAPETCYRSAQGYWPAKIKPATGEVPVGVPMVAPVRTRFEVYCKNDHLVRRVPVSSIATSGNIPCPTCKTVITAQTVGRVVSVTSITPGFEQVGAVAYDGLSSMLAWQMLEMGHRHGRMELKGEGSALGGNVISGDMKFGGTNRADVGFAQTRGEEIVHLTLSIPNLVAPPVFTALTHEDVDERSLSIRGPKISGRAKTDEAPQWVGNCLEAAIIPSLQGSGQQRVLYLDEFVDPAGVKHLVKNRAAPGTMPAMLIDPPEDKNRPDLAFSEFNLGKFFSMLGVALTQSIEAGREKYPNAPGLPEAEEVTYGEEGDRVPASTEKPKPAAPAVGASPAAPKGKPGPKPRPAPIATPGANGKAQDVNLPLETVQPVVEATATPVTDNPVVEETASPVVSTTPVPSPSAPPVVAQAPPAPAARPMMAPPPGVRPAPRSPAGAPRIPNPAARPTPGASS